MIDELYSKMAMLLVAGVLLSTGFLYFANIRDSADSEAYGDIALEVSAAIDQMSSIDGEGVYPLSFGEQGLPRSIGGKYYTINITWDSVRIKQGSSLWSQDLQVPIHCWRPVGDRQISEWSLGLIDSESRYVKIDSRSSPGLSVQRWSPSDMGGPETFVFVQDGEGYNELDLLLEEAGSYLDNRGSSGRLDTNMVTPFRSDINATVIPGAILYETEHGTLAGGALIDLTMDPRGIGTISGPDSFQELRDSCERIDVPAGENIFIEFKAFETEYNGTSYTVVKTFCYN